MLVYIGYHAIYDSKGDFARARCDVTHLREFSWDVQDFEKTSYKFNRGVSPFKPETVALFNRIVKDTNMYLERRYPNKNDRTFLLKLVYPMEEDPDKRFQRDVWMWATKRALLNPDLPWKSYHAYTAMLNGKN